MKDLRMKIWILVCLCLEPAFSCPNGCNTQSSTQNYGMITANFRNSSEILKLDHHLNQTEKLTSEDVISLESHAHVEELNLDDRYLEVIDDDVLGKMKNLKYLTIRRNKLSAITIGTFRGLRLAKKIDLSANRIQVVQSGSFISLMLLDELDLSNNLIELIESGTFRGLRNLRKLYLSGNVMKSISTEMFSDLVLLNKLLLDHNQIQTVSTSAFLILSRLESLNLDGNQIFLFATEVSGIEIISNVRELSLKGNDLCGIPKEALSNFKRLEKIDVSQNPIKVIESLAFHHLNYLKSINISFMPKLKIVAKRAFSHLPLLEEVSLHSNPSLSTIENGAFEEVPKFESMDLHKNALSTLEFDMFSNLKLKTLDVRFNPWTCDCKLVWLQRRLMSMEMSNTTRSNLHDTLCSSPGLNLTNRKIDDQLELEEVLNCSRQGGNGAEADKSNGAQNIAHEDELDKLIILSMFGGIVGVLLIVAVVLVCRHPDSFTKPVYYPSNIYPIVMTYK